MRLKQPRMIILGKYWKFFLSVSLIEPVEPGGAEHSTNDRDLFFEKTVLFTGLNPGYFYFKLFF